MENKVKELIEKINKEIAIMKSSNLCIGNLALLEACKAELERLEAENAKLLVMLKELINYVDDDVHQEDLPECYYPAKALLKHPLEEV